MFIVLPNPLISIILSYNKELAFGGYVVFIVSKLVEMPHFLN